MAKFKCLLGDTFLTVTADTEEQAQEAACELVRSALQPESFIVWEDNREEQPCATRSPE